MTLHMQIQEEPFGSYTALNLTTLRICKVKLQFSYAAASRMSWTMYAPQQTFPIARRAFVRFWDDAGETPDGVDGRSLVPVLEGRADAIHEAVFGYFRDSQRMIRTDRWKLIHYPQIDRWQLFDLPSDPHEQTNLIDEPQHAGVAKALRQRLRAWQAEQGDALVRK